MSDRLIGRQREIDSLRAWLDDARHGRGRTVLVVGEPGVGKTRLATELAALALDEGVRVAWGRCVEGVGGAALWPWQEIRRSLGLPDDLLRPTDGEPDDDRLRAFDALFRAIAGLSADGVLVVLDDAHWADETTLTLLRFVAERVGETHVLVVVNTRDTEPDSHVAPLLATTVSAPTVERLTLRGFDLDEVAERLTIGGTGAGPDAVSAVHAATSGNPFFVSELATAIGDGTWYPGDRPPASVLDVVRARAARLGPECRELVGVAAIAGREGSVELLADAAGRPVPECLPLLDEAIGHGFLEPTGVPGRVRFVHALTRDAIAGSLDTTTRMAHHQAVADAIERSGPAFDDEQLAALAEHWTALVPVAGVHRARQWTARAAGAAARRQAYERAATLYRAALELGGADDGEAFDLEVALARAAFRAGDLVEAARAAREASLGAAGRDDHGGVAAAALTLEAGTDSALNEVAAELCDRALATPPGAIDASDQARLLARRSRLAFYERDLALAAALSEQAAELAHRIRDDGALVEAIRARHESSPGAPNRSVRAQLADELLVVAQRSHDPRSSMWAHLWSIDALAEVGDVASAEERLVALGRTVEQAGGPAATWMYLRATAGIAAGRGDLVTAARTGREAFDVMRSIEPLAARGSYLALANAIAHHGVPPADAVALAHEAPATPAWFAAMARAGRAFLLARAGSIDEAAVLYDEAGSPASWVLPPFAVVTGLASGALAARVLGRRDHFEELVLRFEGARGQHAVTAGVANYLGPVELHLGSLALLLGRLDQAVADLAAAVDITQRGGAVGFLAEARLRLAQALLARDTESDRAQATELADASRRAITTLGLEALVGESVALEGTLGAPTPSVLSVREEEVALLVSEGLSNRQIAERLVISERTAQNHVQHILTKLGFTSRAQITVWASREAR